MIICSFELRLATQMKSTEKEVQLSKCVSGTKILKKIDHSSAIYALNYITKIGWAAAFRKITKLSMAESMG